METKKKRKSWVVENKGGDKMSKQLTKTQFEIIVAMISYNPKLYDKLKVYFK